jgi:long-subunit fatty acid transport protein
MRFKIIFTAFILAVLTGVAFAQFDNVGTSAAAFLKIPVDPRGSALASAVVANANDPSAMYWNPAGLSQMRRTEIMFANTDWIADLNVAFLGVGVPLGNFGAIGVGITYLSMGDMPITTWLDTEGASGQTFSAYDACFAVGYARRLTDKFSIGLSVKYVTEKISHSTASAFALDIGTLYDTGFRGLKIGMSFTNFGTKLRLEGRDLIIKVDPYPTAGSNPSDVIANLKTEEWSLPLTFQMGATFNLIESESFRFTVNADYRDERDYRALGLVGGEFAFKEMFFVRVGGMKRYAVDETHGKFTLNAGAGVRVNIPGSNIGLKFDYSYSDLYRLKQAHRISLGVVL